MSRHIENQLGKRIKKHLFARILEQNKQTNQLFLYVQKSTDNAKISAVCSLADICFLHVHLLIRLIRCIIVSVAPRNLSGVK